MSQANNLLNSLTDAEIKEYSAGIGEREEHIVIGRDRIIRIPESLKRLGVQYDHDIETVMFDCPRYWDEHDMSKMNVYITYKLPDGTLGNYPIQSTNISVDENDPDIMHFSWTISGNVTQMKGVIPFLVCVKKSDTDGSIQNHWNSELCTDAFISEGLETEEVDVSMEYPDLVDQLLNAASTATDKASKAEKAAERAEKAAVVGDNAIEAVERFLERVTVEEYSEELLVDIRGGSSGDTYVLPVSGSELLGNLTITQGRTYSCCLQEALTYFISETDQTTTPTNDELKNAYNHIILKTSDGKVLGSSKAMFDPTTSCLVGTFVAQNGVENEPVILYTDGGPLLDGYYYSPLGDGWTYDRFTLSAVHEIKPTNVLQGINEIATQTANAIKQDVSGEVVRVDDVTPITHTAKVKVHGKNMIPFPYKNKDKIVSAAKYVIGIDGTIRITGIPTDYSAFIINDNTCQIKPAFEHGVTYELNDGINGSYLLIAYADENGKTVFKSSGGANKQFTWDERYTYLHLYTQVNPGIPYNLTLKPALYKYVDLNGATMKQYHKNIFDISGIQTDSYFTNNGDSLVIKTAVAQTSQKLKDFCKGLKVGQEATLSFCTTAYDKTQDIYTDYIYLVGAKQSWKTGTTKTITQEMLDSALYFYAGKDTDGTMVEATVSYIQLEIGDKETAYEAFEVIDHGVPADGLIDISSTHPTMTLCTDTDDLVIDLCYSRDTNIALEEYTITEESKQAIAEIVESDMAEVLESLNAYAASVIGGDS